MAALIYMGEYGMRCLCVSFISTIIVLLRHSTRSHSIEKSGTLLREICAAAEPCIITGMCVVLLTFLDLLPRNYSLFLIFALPLCWLLLVARSIGVLVYIRHEQKKGKFITRLLLVGAGEGSKRMARFCEGNPGRGCHIVGFLTSRMGEVGMMIDNNRVIGLIDDLPRILTMNAVDAIFFDDGSNGRNENETAAVGHVFFIREGKY